MDIGELFDDFVYDGFGVFVYVGVDIGVIECVEVGDVVVEEFFVCDLWFCVLILGK